jgi:hypothetical protein
MELEDKKDDALTIDITAERPDLVSAEGIARAIRAMLGYKTKEYKAKESEYEIIIDKSVEKVSYNKYDNRIAIVLEKAEYEKWEFLTKERGIYKNNIKIDWDKWEDSDGEAEEVDSPVGNLGSPQAPVGNLGSPLAPSSGFCGKNIHMIQNIVDL